MSQLKKRRARARPEVEERSTWLAVILAALAIILGLLGWVLFRSGSEIPTQPSPENIGDAVVFLDHAPPGATVDISVFTGAIFTAQPQVEYKVEVHAPHPRGGMKVRLSLVLTGNPERPPATAVFANKTTDYHSFEEKFTVNRPGPPLTSPEAGPIGDSVGGPETVLASVVQKDVQVLAPYATGGVHDFQGPDALFVISHPKRLGDLKAGRYRLSLPALGGDRGPFSLTFGGHLGTVDNPVGLAPARGEPSVGTQPSAQTIYVALVGLPSGVNVDYAQPQPETASADLQWQVEQKAGSDPLRIRLALSDPAEEEQASRKVFFAGLLLAIAASMLLLALDRVVPSGGAGPRRRLLPLARRCRAR